MTRILRTSLAVAGALCLCLAAISPVNAKLAGNGQNLNGVRLNGVALNGNGVNGTTSQGLAANARDRQGTSFNGFQLQGASSDGSTVRKAVGTMAPAVEAVILSTGETVDLR